VPGRLACARIVLIECWYPDDREVLWKSRVHVFFKNSRGTIKNTVVSDEYHVHGSGSIFLARG
jgi:hypothetical protein